MQNSNLAISIQIAQFTGFFNINGQYWRPLPDSPIAELFNHSKDHNLQAYVIPANKPDKPAFKCGGSEYTLQEFADALRIDLGDYIKTTGHEPYNNGSKKSDNGLSLDARYNYARQRYIPTDVLNRAFFLSNDWFKLRVMDNQGKTRNVQYLEEPRTKLRFFSRQTITKQKFQVKALFSSLPYKKINNSSELFLCEGFWDFASLLQIENQVLGLQGSSLLDTDILAEYLKDFPKLKTIYFTADRDIVYPEPNQKALAQKLLKSLKDFCLKHGLELVILTTLDLPDYAKLNNPKDINDVLVSVKGNLSEFKQRLDTMINIARNKGNQENHEVHTVQNEMVEHVQNSEKKPAPKSGGNFVDSLEQAVGLFLEKYSFYQIHYDKKYRPENLFFKANSQDNNLEPLYNMDDSVNPIFKSFINSRFLSQVRLINEKGSERIPFGTFWDCLSTCLQEHDSRIKINDIKTPILNWKIHEQNNNFFIYERRPIGYYKRLTESEAKTIIKTYFPLKKPSRIDNILNEILMQNGDACRKIDPDTFLKHRKTAIPFLNGVFDLNDGKFRSYRLDEYLIDPIPHDFIEKPDKNKIQKLYDNYIRQWFLNTDQTKDEQDELMQYVECCFAYACYQYPNTEQVLFNFYGSGENGKSICSKMLGWILGDSLTKQIDINQVNQFSTSGWEWKKLLIAGDVSSNTILDNDTTGLLKRLVESEGKIACERKGKDPYDSTITYIPLLVTNSIVSSKDKSRGFFRRVIPLLFPNTFDHHSINTEKVENELKELIPDYASYLCTILYMYRKSGVLLKKTMPRSSKEIHKDIRTAGNPVRDWVEETYFDEEEKENWEVIREVNDFKISAIYEKFKVWFEKEYQDEDLYVKLRGRNGFGGNNGKFLEIMHKYFNLVHQQEGNVLKFKRDLPEYQKWVKGQKE